jgi:hypothetical protein
MNPNLSIIAFATLTLGFIAGLRFGVARAKRAAANHLPLSKRHLVGWILIGLGCGCLLAGAECALYSWNFLRDADRAPGQVIALRPLAGHEDAAAPTFTFVDAAGRTNTVEAPRYSSPPKFKIGEKISVLYAHDDPAHAVIDTFGNLWGLATVTAVLGAVYLPLGLFLVGRSRPSGLPPGSPRPGNEPAAPSSTKKQRFPW